jgi:lipoprotein-anchoring transpeptidase ErfK/SrfK
MDERLLVALNPGVSFTTSGPNNPVGSTWIDLAKDSYGIDRTPHPEAIGKTASHGCARLTNWDAQELAAAVHAGTTVVFNGRAGG